MRSAGRVAMDSQGMQETWHVYYGKLEELTGDVAPWKERLPRMHEALRPLKVSIKIKSSLPLNTEGRLLSQSSISPGYWED